MSHLAPNVRGNMFSGMTLENVHRQVQERSQKIQEAIRSVVPDAEPSHALQSLEGLVLNSTRFFRHAAVYADAYDEKNQPAGEHIDGVRLLEIIGECNGFWVFYMELMPELTNQVRAWIQADTLNPPEAQA